MDGALRAKKLFEKSEGARFILNAICGGHPVRRRIPKSPDKDGGLKQSTKYRRSSPFRRDLTKKHLPDFHQQVFCA
ncbi:MAG: hypothetical protein ABIT37_25100 [Luteolibacter sp.]